MASPRPRLSRQSIVSASLAALDRDGLAALSLRRIAADLGVQSPALYWHFESKRDLLDAIADVIVNDASLRSPAPDEAWSTWLMTRALDYRRALLAHPDAARIVMDARLTPATLGRLDEELRELARRGVPPLAAIDTIGTISRYTLAYVMAEQTTRDEPPERVAQRGAEAVTALGPDSPLLAVVAADTDSDARFQRGVQLIIDGLRATAT